MSINVFERAARRAYRYPSNKGELTTEQLWQLPLQSKNGFDLDSVAKAINAQIKASAEESFVTPAAVDNPSTELKYMLGIVVAIISTKVAERDAAQTAAVRKAERDRLTQILHLRTEQDLMQLTPEELQKRIAELS